jgi:hypothetical protein
MKKAIRNSFTFIGIAITNLTILKEVVKYMNIDFYIGLGITLVITLALDNYLKEYTDY